MGRDVNVGYVMVLNNVYGNFSVGLLNGPALFSEGANSAVAAGRAHVLQERRCDCSPRGILRPEGPGPPLSSPRDASFLAENVAT